MFMPSFVLLRKLGLYLALFITLTVPASAQGKTVQTMNGLAFPDVPPNSPYSFLVIGHAYGRSVSTHNLPHHLPAASLLGNVEKLRRLKPDFVLTLGDVYWRLETKWVDSFKRMIMDRLNVPFVNAIGNHDITRLTDNEKVVLEPDEYRRRFGPTYYSFRVGSVLHIVLDTVTEGAIDNGSPENFP